MATAAATVGWQQQRRDRGLRPAHHKASHGPGTSPHPQPAMARRLLPSDRLQVCFLLLVNVTVVTIFVLYGWAHNPAPAFDWTPNAPFPERQRRWRQPLADFQAACGARDGPPSPTRAPASILFIKTHRTGSSTVANVLLRHALASGRPVCLPVFDDAHMGWPRAPTPLDAFSPGRGGQCRLVAHHAVFRQDGPLPRLFPRGQPLVRFTLVRHPLHQLRSALFFLEEVEQLKLPVRGRLEALLNDPRKAEALVRFPGGGTISLGRNFLAHELGFEPGRFSDDDEFVAFVERHFDLVGVAERLPESLVLLRRAAGLPFSALTFARLNRNMALPAPGPDSERRHRELNPLDYKLYEHFRAKLEATARRQGPDFRREVHCVALLNTAVRVFCTHAAKEDVLHLPATPWQAAFRFPASDCLGLLSLPRDLTPAIRDAQFSTADSIVYFLRRWILKLVRY